MYDTIFAFMYARQFKTSQQSCFLYISMHKSVPTHHLIIQLFVKLADFLLIFLPLLFRDAHHNGGDVGGGAAGATDVERWLLGFGRHRADLC